MKNERLKFLVYDEARRHLCRCRCSGASPFGGRIIDAYIWFAPFKESGIKTTVTLVCSDKEGRVWRSSGSIQTPKDGLRAAFRRCIIECCSQALPRFPLRLGGAS